MMSFFEFALMVWLVFMLALIGDFKWHNYKKNRVKFEVPSNDGTGDLVHLRADPVEKK
jgi:hypothetical protein